MCVPGKTRNSIDDDGKKEAAQHGLSNYCILLLGVHVLYSTVVERGIILFEYRMVEINNNYNSLL
jgi:hypothetical protein